MDEFMVQLLQEKNRKALSENQNHNDVMGHWKSYGMLWSKQIKRIKVPNIQSGIC